MEDDFFLDTPSTPVDPDDLRQAMRLWATGVAVVTSAHKGEMHGMTVSSFTSVSLTPPQVLISLAQNTRTHALVKKSHLFGVTVLSSELEDRFAGLETLTLTTGVPLLRGGIAQFDCRVIATFTSGTHTLFIGEVLAAQGDLAPKPLLYFNRGYRKIE
jgi:flavin reductase (DIM6/NTAB) family NADH-FMN oxidoreductase RutF